MRREPTFVLDCRWLGIGGPGRTTEFVLRGLAEVSPAGRWLLWGPEQATTALAWPGAEVCAIAEDPRVLLGQRRAFEVPRGDFSIFMHQQRPLRSLAAATVIYDTIALRHGSSRAQRAVKRQFMKRIARTSQRILTISEHSRASILRDLGPAPEVVSVLRFPFDDCFVDRVLTLRRSTERVDAALFIGGFLPHKNLPRLVAAFGHTDYRRSGGRLILVGGTAAQAHELLETLTDAQRSFVTVRHSCSQGEIERLYASARFLVQPSLEEGFGLPAWEAMCCGLPICVSDGGSLPEVTLGFAEPFPATSETAMTTAIDACAESSRHHDVERAAEQSALIRESAPTVGEFGAQFHSLVSEHLVTR